MIPLDSDLATAAGRASKHLPRGLLELKRLELKFWMGLTV